MRKHKFFSNDSIFREQAEACVKFFKELKILLNEDYQRQGTGKFPKEFFVEGTEKGIFRLNDQYLIPRGTRSQITYYGKPHWSFRLSDHWNWYETVGKCNQRQYIQCFNVDLPRLNNRYVEDHAHSPACYSIQVAIFGNHDDEAYHCVYGSYKNKETRKWEWMEKTPQQVIAEWNLG